MPKRSFHAANGEQHTQDQKKARLQDAPAIGNEFSITSAGSLKRLLTFHQDDVAQYRANLQTFRRYLESLSSDQNSASIDDGILLEYLTSNTTTKATTDQVETFPDLFQAWRYAAQVYDEGLMPTIPGVLATLLEVISSSLKFIDVGIQICRTLMRKENVQLFQKSMNSSRTRDTTVARCLDLLTQIVSFDGGACSKAVWLQRDTTMSRMSQWMTMTKKSIYGTFQSSSVRDHAIPFLLANLRYQDQEAKAEILSSRKAFENMLQEISSEPVTLIKAILSTIKQYIIEDQNLGRSAKGHLLTDRNLGHILGIVRQGHSEENKEAAADEGWTAIQGVAEELLTQSCTSRSHGIVYKQHGWYPPGTEDNTVKEDIPFFGGFVPITETNKYKDRVPVRNTTLAAFTQDLKPWASVSERKLILAIFEAAPELVADYFARKKAFSFEPKLTITWIGWAAFIYSAIRLPLPSIEKYVDGRIRQPPPVSIVLQSILPQPLTAQALIKAIKHQADLVKLFTVRILVAAFEKVQQVLASVQTVPSLAAWQALAAEVLHEFQARCPEYTQVLSLYQTLPKDKHILREALSSLLAKYHTITPNLVHGSDFDISSSITKMLNQIVEQGDQCDGSTLLEMEHLFLIGSSTIEARWWQKAEKAPTSTMTTILKLLASSGIRRTESLKTLVQNILEESFVIDSSQGRESLEALLRSLAAVNESSTKAMIYFYLDDCLLRLVKKPVKYHGDIRDLIQASEESRPISPVFMTLLEQWPFFSNVHTDSEMTTCADWICAYISCSANIGQSVPQLQELCSRFSELTEHPDTKRIFDDCKPAIPAEERRYHSNGLVAEAVLDDQSHSIDRILENDMAALDFKLTIPKESQDYPALTKWQAKPVQEAVMDGHVTNLIYCLASSYREIRIQATSALKLLMRHVQSSKYEERQSLYLLLGILQETISGNDLSNALPSIAISLAARSVTVLNNPLHPMYTKINHFLSRAPSWNIAKLPSYWMDKIFNKPPTQLGAHWKEVNWLLETLIDGLRNPDDTNLYRRTAVFERILVNCSAAETPVATFNSAIDILYRAALIPGGATTLITRFGILAWLAAQKATNPNASAAALIALETKLRRSADSERIAQWSRGNIRCGEGWVPHSHRQRQTLLCQSEQLEQEFDGDADRDTNTEGSEKLGDAGKERADILDAYEKLSLFTAPVSVVMVDSRRE